MTDALPTLIGVVLVACAAGLALLPLLERTPAAPGPTTGAEPAAEAERFRLYRQVLELEFDAQTGKLAADDLEALRAELLGRAGQLLRTELAQTTTTGPVDDVESAVEREIAAARRAFAEARRGAQAGIASP